MDWKVTGGGVSLSWCAAFLFQLYCLDLAKRGYVSDRAKYYIKIFAGNEYLYLECDKGIDHFLDLMLVLQHRGVSYTIIDVKEYENQAKKISSSKFFSKYEKLI